MKQRDIANKADQRDIFDAASRKPADQEGRPNSVERALRSISNMATFHQSNAPRSPRNQSEAVLWRSYSDSVQASRRMEWHARGLDHLAEGASQAGCQRLRKGRIIVVLCCHRECSCI